MFGHAASSHTVTIFLSFSSLFVSLKNFEVGAFTLIQLGFLGIGFDLFLTFQDDVVDSCRLNNFHIDAIQPYLEGIFQNIAKIFE